MMQKFVGSQVEGCILKNVYWGLQDMLESGTYIQAEGKAEQEIKGSQQVPFHC